MTRPLRAGIIGPGFIGTVHARAVLAAGGVLTRVAASTFEDASRAAHHARDRAERRGLAGAVRAEHGDHRSLLHRERDAVQHVDRPVPRRRWSQP